MGGISSNTNQHLEKELGADYPEGEVFVGFENNSNICYANSVIQAFFQCKEFRRYILEYKSKEVVYQAKTKENVITITQDLFLTLTKSKKRTGVTNIKKLMSFTKKRNEEFKGDYHQDCHEFLTWYINEIDDVLNGKSTKKPNKKQPLQALQGPKQFNWLQQIFQGLFVTRTQPISLFQQLESERQEPFFSLSIDIEPNTSLSHCIRKLSREETMRGEDKFHCDTCKSLQEANQRLLIKQLPPTIIIHFKRFKYDEKYKSMVKISSKVPFPFDLKIETSYYDDPEQNTHKYYDLSAIVIHYGQGISFGHYIVIVKIQGRWFSFDDDQIQIYPELDIYQIYGRNFGSNHTGCAYMLFYNEKQRE